MEILTRIATDQRYIIVCKRLYGGRIEYKDLMQDTLLKLADYEQACLKAEKDGFLYAYVLRTIYSIFLNDKKKKKLHIIDIDYFHNLECECELPEHKKIINEIYQASVKHELNRASELSRIAVGELHRKMTEKQEGASELWSVCHSSINRVAKDSGKSFFKLKKQIEPVIKQLKRKLDE